VRFWIWSAEEADEAETKAMVISKFLRWHLRQMITSLMK
jgi:hypothetical protein